MLVFREANKSDVEGIANLHALSWQQHYKASFSEHFLDNEVHADRLKVWKDRFLNPSDNQYVLIAEDKQKLVGFACAYFDQDAKFGTYLDNLHVTAKVKGKGVGTAFMEKLAKEILNRNLTKSFYLWVLDTNLPAIAYYEKLGGQALDKVEANDIGDRDFVKIRYVWNNMNDLLNRIIAKRRV